MADYQQFADLTNDLLSEYGSDEAKLVTKSGSFNADTGEYEGVVESEVAINAVFLPVKKAWIDGQTVKLGDMVVKAGTKNIDAEPEAGEKIKRGDDIYKIIEVQNIKPAEDTILFDLHVRKE